MDWRVRKNCIPVFTCMLAIGTATQARTLRVGTRSTAEYHSIKSAVQAAHDGDVIILEEDRYSSNACRNVTIDNKAITIRSRDPNDPAVVARTIIDCRGGETQGHRAFDVQPGDATRLVLEGLTIVNGGHLLSGGAVFCEGARLRVYNCTFSGGYVEQWGGAVYCRDSHVSMEGCTFSNNVSETAHGGAIYCATGVLELENCTFENNRGSAVESNNSSLTLARCAFRQNTGRTGGAIHSRTDTGPQAALRLQLSRCEFLANAADASGGALYHHKIDPVLDGCTFIANTAGADGGAILNYHASPVLTNCVLAGNTAAGLGGAMLSQFDSNPQIINCTLVANHASCGGALAGQGQGHTLVSHCILWDNTAGRGSALCLARYIWGGAYTASATVEYSDIQAGRGGINVEPECTLTWSAGNLDAEPLFAGPADDDYRLSPDSPCIDAGDPRYAPPSDATDLDMYSRQFGAAVDLGAYEYRGLRPVYRFWTPCRDRDFYTISEVERDLLVEQASHLWILQDVAYYAFHQPLVEDLRPVYRFWSPRLEAHFWTISEQERRWLEQEASGVWIAEGVAFYAFPPNLQPPGTLPIYRFWSGSLGCHFYTIAQAEKDNLAENHSDLWEFEGVAWHAYSKPHQIGGPIARQFVAASRYR